MPDENLRAQSIEYYLNRVEGLAAAASKDQVQSIMAVLARCTIELADQAKQLSADINSAKKTFLPPLGELITELKQTRLEISKASSSALEGSKALVKWTKALVFVTIVYAAATLGMLLVMIFRSPPH